MVKSLAVRQVLRWILPVSVSVLLLNAIGWGLLVYLLAAGRPSRQPSGDRRGYRLAYTLGLRHAFDADHIAAIDNTTRKLIADGQRPTSVGFFFSIGHSCIVFVMCILVGIGVETAGHSPGGNYFGFLQTLISGGFLYVIAGINLIALVSIVTLFKRARRAGIDASQIASAPGPTGIMYRIFGTLAKRIDAPWKILPVGVLFGLGFDTATEVALLALSSSAASQGNSIASVICLPCLFAAGMSLFDTADGIFMCYAYDWAMAQPLRRLYYNGVVTSVSVLAAMVIGTVEIFSVLDTVSWCRGPWFHWATHVSLNLAGYIVVALFAVVWLVALLAWRLLRMQERSEDLPHDARPATSALASDAASGRPPATSR